MQFISSHEERFNDAFNALLNSLSPGSPDFEDQRDALQEAALKFWQVYGLESLDQFPEHTLRNCLQKMAYNQRITSYRRPSRRKERTNCEPNQLERINHRDFVRELADEELFERYLKELTDREPMLLQVSMLRALRTCLIKKFINVLIQAVAPRPFATDCLPFAIASLSVTAIHWNRRSHLLEIKKFI